MSLMTSLLLLWGSLSPGITGVVVSACLAAILYWILLPQRWRVPGLLVFSLVALVASGASVWLILLLVMLTLMTQAVASRQPDSEPAYSGGLVVASLIIVVAAMLCLLGAALWAGSAAIPDFLSLSLLWSAFQTEFVPQTGFLILAWVVVAGLFALAVAAVAVLRRAAPASLRRLLGYFAMISILGAFVVLKLRPLSLPALVTWVGFSYFAFRLLHVILDSFNDQFADASSLEALVYALFFPALLIGPIDRLPRFLKDMRGDSQTFRWGFVVEGMTRILIGGVKKFFLADLLLSRVALGSELSPFPGAGFAWVQLYAYALYIFFDFSGYTDIALGTGRMLGYSLPENFVSPYLKPSITRFWQSWHMTLSGWLRDYVFFPISRRLLQTPMRRTPYLILFVAHLTTMILIGLWHGISINFVLWGAWHGLGLFVHKVFTDKTRRWQLYWQKHSVVGRAVDVGGMMATFHFVTLGWVFFALQRPADSLAFLMRLLGVSN